jgi:hypothetical protein
MIPKPASTFLPTPPPASSPPLTFALTILADCCRSHDPNGTVPQTVPHAVIKSGANGLAEATRRPI